MKNINFKQSPEAIVLGLVSGLLVIYFIVSWRWQTELAELLYVSAGIGLISVLSKKVALWVARGWMAFGQLLGKLIGGVLLSTVYLLILIPLARLQSLVSKSDKFAREENSGMTSSWRDRRHTFSLKYLEELW